LGEAVLAKLGLATEALHLDSTSFHYDGQASNDGELGHIRIAKGYSRDHRPELNQVILNLICENQSGIPVYMKPAVNYHNNIERSACFLPHYHQNKIIITFNNSVNSISM